VLVVAITAGIAMNGGRLGSSQLIDAHFDPKRMPVDAVNYLRDRHAQGPVFCPDIWGGYLIYSLYPSVEVVVDDRHDLYGSEFLKSYLQTMRGERNWDEFLRQHTAAWLVLPRNSALASILAQTKDWRSVYADETAIVFVPDVKNR
jgi:hypothetical protein